MTYQISINHLAFGNQMWGLSLVRYSLTTALNTVSFAFHYDIILLIFLSFLLCLCQRQGEDLNGKVKRYTHRRIGDFFFPTSSFLYQPINRLETEAVSTPTPILIKPTYWKVNSSSALLGFDRKGHPPPFIHSTTLVPSIQKDMHGKNARVS